MKEILQNSAKMGGKVSREKKKQAILNRLAKESVVIISRDRASGKRWLGEITELMLEGFEMEVVLYLSKHLV